MRNINSEAYNVLSASANEANTSFRTYVTAESESDPGFFRWFFQDNDLEDFENPEEDAFNAWIENNRESIYDIAGDDFEVIETTTGLNGYPRDLKKAIIGFESFEQARDLAKRYGMDVEFFDKKDGWQLWHRSGNRAFEAIKPTADDFGDDYRTFTKLNLPDFFENEVRPLLTECDDFEGADAILKQMREVFDAIEDMEPGEMVVTNEGRYFDTISAETMSFHEDTTTTAIGLIFRD